MVKGKLIAFGVHGALTVFVASVVATVIYLLWYPGNIVTMLKGDELFRLVVGVEILLGPTMSLIIYNREKSRRELVKDYVVVGFIQFAALGYGIYSVAQTRPLYMIFDGQMLHTVTAVDISEIQGQEIKGVENWSGPRLRCLRKSESFEEEASFVLSLLNEDAIGVLVKNMDKCEPSIAEQEFRTVNELLLLDTLTVEQKSNLSKYPGAYWLPVSSKYGYWTAVFQSFENKSIEYLNIDPTVFPVRG